MNSATISVARPELKAFRPRDSKRSNGLLLDLFFHCHGGGEEIILLPKCRIIRLALVASVGPVAAGLILASNTFAQNPPPPPPGAAAAPAPAPGAAEVERVIVTGSNIPTAEEVGPNPVFSLNRDLINKSGQGTTTEQLLKAA